MLTDGSYLLGCFNYSVNNEGSYEDNFDPVDVVIPWSGESKNDISGVNRDDGIIKYSIRSILKNLPWIRLIFVFADPMPRRPSLFQEFGQKVKLIDRCRNFIGGKENCPTENTYAVYANFHTISNLAEKFIVIDDDIVITKTLEKDNFFKNGKVLHKVGKQTQLYKSKYIIMKNGTGRQFIKQLNTGYGDAKPLVQLPSKYPFNAASGLSDHRPLPFLKSSLIGMNSDYQEWFEFVSSHRARFCFTDEDRYALKEHGNKNGACYQENTPGAVYWYMAKEKKLLSLNDITGHEMKYNDISSNKVLEVLQGNYYFVNINDPVVWKSTKLQELATQKGLQAYNQRKQRLLLGLEKMFPKAG